jgi:rhodanese-related sulfurtransferase
MKQYLLLSLMVLLAIGCSRGDFDPEKDIAKPGAVRSIRSSDAAVLLERHQDMLILDVRTSNELREGSIEGSVLVPFWSLVQSTENLPRNRPVMVVCAVGGRSYAAGQLLVRNDFEQVYNLRGGISAWKRAGLPVKYYRVSPF